MEIVQYSYPYDIYLPNNIKSLMKDNSICFVDIETTGFSRSKDMIMLIGVLSIHENSIQIKQFFANHPNEESNLMKEFEKYIKNFQLIVTFNGDAFDIPFINSKFQQYNIEHIITKEQCHDLYKDIKSHRDILNFENYKLKTIEIALGITREDNISGKESIELYNKYIRTKEESLKSLILQHNHDDIYYLPAILKIYDMIDNESSLSVEIPSIQEIIQVVLDFKSIKLTGSILKIYGHTSKHDLPDHIYYDESYTLNWCPLKGSLLISVNVNEGLLSNNNKCFYIDKSDYSIRIDTIDKSSYKLPENIILIKESKSILADNLKNFIKELMISTLENS